MVTNNIGITKARVKTNVFEPVFYKREKIYKAVLRFSEVNSEVVKLLGSVYFLLGKNYDEAVKEINKKLKNLTDILEEGKLVNILFDMDTNNILAVSAPESDRWIDFQNKFRLVRFNRLGIDINNLTVF